MLQPFHLGRRKCYVIFENQIQDEKIIVGGGNGIQKCCLTGKVFAIKKIQEVLGIAQTDDVLRVLARERSGGNDVHYFDWIVNLGGRYTF